MSESIALIEALCREVEAFLGDKSPELRRQKWIRTEKGEILQESPDYESLLVFAINPNTAAYQGLEQWLTADPVFSLAPKKAGYYGRPEALIRHFLLAAMYVKDGRTKLDPGKAYEFLTHTKACLRTEEVIYEAKARLLGVELTAPSVTMGDLRLVKLTDEEMNDRQPYIGFPALLSDLGSDLLAHHAEIRMTLRVSVDDQIETPILSTQNVAISQAQQAFTDAISALRLYKSGSVELGPVAVSNFLPYGVAIGKLYSLYVPHIEMQIGNPDLDALQQAYRIMNESRSQDKVLDRALHRFLLGRQRYDLSDRLIDYVIAWESLLLTVGGNSIEDELSYRFGINGASILNASGVQIDRDAGLRVMKGSYSVRSKIVHGTSNKAIDKAVTDAGFNNLVELVIDLEEKFRGVIFWLSSLSFSDRPYKKSGGWGQLLWGNPNSPGSLSEKMA